MYQGMIQYTQQGRAGQTHRLHVPAYYIKIELRATEPAEDTYDHSWAERTHRTATHSEHNCNLYYGTVLPGMILTKFMVHYNTNAPPRPHAQSYVSPPKKSCLPVTLS